VCVCVREKERQREGERILKKIKILRNVKCVREREGEWGGGEREGKTESARECEREGQSGGVRENLGGPINNMH